jgi:hypothetical protein
MASEKLQYCFRFKLLSLYFAVTLREEYRLGVIQNRVPRRIFGPERDTV